MSDQKQSLAQRLASLRDQLRQRHRHHEETPGTGWHRKDQNSPHQQERTPLSRRPIAFQDDDHIHLVGEDADVVIGAVKEFAQVEDDSADARRAHALAGRIDEYVRKEGELTVLTLPSQRWNEATYAVANVGLDVCLSDANPKPARPEREKHPGVGAE